MEYLIRTEKKFPKHIKTVLRESKFDDEIKSNRIPYLLE